MNQQLTFLDDIYPEWHGKKKTTSPLFDSLSCEWETPQKLFDQLNAEFHFTVDVCSTDENAKCKKHYTKKDNGLIQDWSSETVWCNPPYGNGIEEWCRKCYEHFVGGGTAVMLLPARTDTKWFHKWVYGKSEIRFIEGRIKFGNSKWNAPFPSMLVIYKGEKNNGGYRDENRNVGGFRVEACDSCHAESHGQLG